MPNVDPKDELILGDPEAFQISEERIDQMREKMAAQMQGHLWQQRGIEVYCTSCRFNHGFIVQPGIFVTGTAEDGKPILKKLY